MNVPPPESQPATIAMKSKSIFALFLSVLLAVIAPRAAQARVEVSFDFFYDSLEPFGEWVEVADYGLCWHPTDVDREWAPYSDGYWAFTDAGWTWVSYEEFGGLVYHYGRWVFVDDEGWCWQPGYDWGPAWVSWRSSDDYVGWAPLPPRARWRPERGISVWVDSEYDIGPTHYSFCRVQNFGAPVLRPVIINRIENVTIIRRTVNITNITCNTSYGAAPLVYNGGPDYAFINRQSTRPIPALKLVQRTEINQADIRSGRGGNRVRALNAQALGNQLIVAAPFITPSADPAALKLKAKKSFAAEKVTTGWNGVKDPAVRDELKQQFQRQTKGLNPETAPAKPVAAADLKVVPVKADAQATPPTTGRDSREKMGRGEKPAAIAILPATPASPPTATTGTLPIQPSDVEKTAREKARGRMTQPTEVAAPGMPLKPFNPVVGADRKPIPQTVPDATPKPPAEIAREKDRKPREKSGTPPIAGVPTTPEQPVPRPSTTPEKLREQTDAAARAAAQAEQERIARQRAAAAAQQQQQMEAQQNALRQHQQEQAAAAERQKIQAEKDRAARKQADAAAATQKQQLEAQQQQRAAQESARRQADQQRLVDQNRAVEQARRAQEAAREQMRQQTPPQRTTQPPPPAAPAQGATPVPDGGKHRKDKDKDKNSGN